MSASCTRKFVYQQEMLFFFNRRLLEERFITEKEYRKMRLKIQARNGEKKQQG